MRENSKFQNPEHSHTKASGIDSNDNRVQIQQNKTFVHKESESVCAKKAAEPINDSILQAMSG